MSWYQSNGVHIRNIPKSLRNETDLLIFFSRFGYIRHIHQTCYWREDEALIEFSERKSALNAVEMKHLNGMIITKGWKDSDMTLDRLNFDCLFEIYSYLTLEIPFYIKNKNEDFLKCIRGIYNTISEIFEFINRPISNLEIPILHNLQLGASNVNFDVESQSRPSIKQISLTLFDFAFLEVEDLYFIQDICPKLNALTIYDDTKSLGIFQYLMLNILKESQALKLSNSDLYLRYFTSDIKDDMELKIIAIESIFEELRKLGEIDSLRSLNDAVKCLQKIGNIINNIFVPDRGTILQEIQKVVDFSVAPYFTNNFKYLSQSDLGKILDVLKVDFDFYNITEDDCEYFANFEKLRYFKIISHPFILESAELSAAIQQLMSYNTLEKLEINIKWLECSDDFEQFVKNLKLKIEKLLNRVMFKNSLKLKIRVFHLDRSNQFKFVLRDFATSQKVQRNRKSKRTKK